MNPQTVKASSNMKIVLTSDNKTLDEVVVTGYQKPFQRKWRYRSRPFYGALDCKPPQWNHSRRKYRRYRNEFYFPISENIMSTAIVIYFGKWIKSVIPINLIVPSLYCYYLGIPCTLVFALIRVHKRWWDDITQGKQ